MEALPSVWDFNYLQEEENPVFSILRSSFDCLKPVYQSLFMDLILFNPLPTVCSELEIEFQLGLMEWLAFVYNQDMQVIETWLQHLKGRRLLEDVDVKSQRVYVHDLYREFARVEAEGKLKESAEFGRRKWALYSADTFPAELERTPDRSCWQNLIRVGIGDFEDPWYGRSAVDSLQGIEWLNCSNVVVLMLCGLLKLRGDLNLKGLRCLRSLELVDINALDTLDGLQDLNNLTYFGWLSKIEEDPPSQYTRMGLLPASLKVLCLECKVLLRSDVFARCTKLSMVVVSHCHAECLDFSNCTSLQRVFLLNCGGVETVEFTNCTSLERAELDVLKSLRTVSGLSAASMSCLQSLVIKYCGLEQSIDFRCNFDLRSLEGVFGDLPALRSLNLEGCRWLSRLPDLSGLRNLEELFLAGSGIEIGEADMCMLASLPLLHPVQVGLRWSCILRLDVVRRKVLKRVQLGWAEDLWSKWTNWEERDFSMLPIKVSCIEWATLKVSSQVSEDGLGCTEICLELCLKCTKSSLVD